MNIIFRVDASVAMGTGHLMRCLTLAQALRKKYDASVTFICRAHEGHLAKLIRQKSFEVFLLPSPEKKFIPEAYPAHARWLGETQDIDAKQTINIIQNNINRKINWLIVDHYGIEAHWHRALNPYAEKIMVIDDLADRHYHCDLLLDQNYYQDMHSRYQGKVSADCKVLSGPQYSLLREEFTKTGELAKWRQDKPDLLLFFGGSDPDNATGSAINAVIPLLEFLGNVHVVVGKNNVHVKQIEALCASYPQLKFHFDIDYMPQLMWQSQLFVGAVGSTTWERCALGLPAIVVTVAKNQEQLAEDLEKIGAHKYLGKFSTEKDLTAMYQKETSNLLTNHSTWRDMQKKSLNLTDGKGTRKVIRMMERISGE